MRIVLLRSVNVHGRDMHAGDEIECTNKEATLWCALAWARKKDSDSIVTATPAGEEALSRGRNRYRRRDMKVED
jgi:hypothetical protein